VEDWRTREVPEQMVSAGNKSVDSGNISTAPRKKRKEVGGPPGRKTPLCSEDPDATRGRRGKIKGTPRSLTPSSSLPEAAPDAIFQAALPDVARIASRGRLRRRARHRRSTGPDASFGSRSRRRWRPRQHLQSRSPTPRQAATFPSRAPRFRPHLLPANATGRRHPRCAPRPRCFGSSTTEGTIPPTTTPPLGDIDTGIFLSKGRLLPPPRGGPALSPTPGQELARPRPPDARRAPPTRDPFGKALLPYLKLKVKII
jgi:hypothetical protein